MSEKDNKNYKEIVLDEITFNNKIYYVDENKCMWNIGAKLVGVLINYNDDDTPICSLFEDNESMEDD